MRYRYQEVERVPKLMQEGVVYHTEAFGLAGLLCACGCGHRITLIVPDSHQVVNEGGWATIWPSIGVLDASCKSHYFINAGEVRILPPFTDAAASSVMQAQIARHVAGDVKPVSFSQRAKAIVLRVLDKLSALFR